MGHGELDGVADRFEVVVTRDCRPGMSASAGAAQVCASRCGGSISRMVPTQRTSPWAMLTCSQLAPFVQVETLRWFQYFAVSSGSVTAFHTCSGVLAMYVT
jgi:hypothetical protein